VYKRFDDQSHGFSKYFLVDEHHFLIHFSMFLILQPFGFVEYWPRSGLHLDSIYIGQFIIAHRLLYPDYNVWTHSVAARGNFSDAANAAAVSEGVSACPVQCAILMAKCSNDD
jgi:hypothetical protein